MLSDYGREVPLRPVTVRPRSSVLGPSIQQQVAVAAQTIHAYEAIHVVNVERAWRPRNARRSISSLACSLLDNERLVMGEDRYVP